MNTKTTTPTNDYTWHDNAMKGIRGPIHDGDPQSGWYRNRRLISAKGETPKKFEFEAVAYWKDTKSGEQRCAINGKSIGETPLQMMWPFASVHPITEETYDNFLATGRWPDQNDVVAALDQLSNEAPDDDSLEGIRARIDALRGEASRLIKKGAAKTQAEADAGADVAVKLGELYSFANKRREAEKAPHLEAGRVVDAAWNPVRDSALIYKDLKETVCDPYIAAENARKKKIADDAAAEQRRILKDAADKAAAAQKVIDDAHAAAVAKAEKKGKAAPPPPEPAKIEVPEVALEPIPEYVPTRAGTGRTVSSRVVKSALIGDYKLALAHFAEHPEIKALVQELANKLAKANMPTPGCTIIEGSKTV